MSFSVSAADERVLDVQSTDDTLSVSLCDGRVIAVPLVWYPRLLNATSAQRQNWKVAGGGYGIHWPDLDEDLSTEGLLRGVPAPASAELEGQVSIQRPNSPMSPGSKGMGGWLKQTFSKVQETKRSGKSFVDRVLKCLDCGADFVFTAGEQLFFHEKQFKNEPKYCKNCKVRRVSAGTDQGAGQGSKAICSGCGREITVPFGPTQGRPIYCSECSNQHSSRKFDSA